MISDGRILSTVDWDAPVTAATIWARSDPAVETEVGPSDWPEGRVGGAGAVPVRGFA